MLVILSLEKWEKTMKSKINKVKTISIKIMKILMKVSMLLIMITIILMENFVHHVLLCDSVNFVLDQYFLFIKNL